LRRRDPAFSMNRSSQLGQLAFGGARIRGYVAKRKVLFTYIGKVIRAELHKVSRSRVARPSCEKSDR
jgi:hypothetical protein